MRLAVVTFDQANARAIRKIQERHFEECGDSSFYAIPPVLVLGESQRKTFDRMSVRIDHIFSSSDAFSSPLGWLIGCGGKLDQTRARLDLTGPCGLYFSKEKPSFDFTIALKRGRLAMLIVHEDFSELVQ